MGGAQGAHAPTHPFRPGIFPSVKMEEKQKFDTALFHRSCNIQIMSQYRAQENNLREGGGISLSNLITSV